MREIKFRMWNSCGDKSKFLYSFQALECMNQQQLGIYDHEKDGCAFEQFTGLRDKNGKEIYEGDILGGCIGLVVHWCNKCHGFQLTYPNEGCFSCNGDVFINEFEKEDFEVVGNIHENPELLK